MKRHASSPVPQPVKYPCNLSSPGDNNVCVGEYEIPTRQWLKSLHFHAPTDEDCCESPLDDPLRNGVLLCSLVNLLHTRSCLPCIPNYHKRPTSLQQARENTESAVSSLRTLNIPPVFLHSTEDILKGNKYILWGMLFHVMESCGPEQPALSDIQDIAKLRISFFSAVCTAKCTVPHYKRLHTHSYSPDQLASLEQTLLQWLTALGLLILSKPVPDESTTPLTTPVVVAGNKEGGGGGGNNSSSLTADSSILSIPPVSITAPIVYPYVRNGTLFCDLLALLSNCKVKGITRNPRVKAACLSNIQKAMNGFTKLPEVCKSWFCYTEGEEIYSGDILVIMGILEDLYRVYHKVSIHLYYHDNGSSESSHRKSDNVPHRESPTSYAAINQRVSQHNNSHHHTNTGNVNTHKPTTEHTRTHSKGHAPKERERDKEQKTKANNHKHHHTQNNTPTVHSHLRTPTPPPVAPMLLDSDGYSSSMCIATGGTPVISPLPDNKRGTSPSCTPVELYTAIPTPANIRALEDNSGVFPEPFLPTSDLSRSLLPPPQKLREQAQMLQQKHWEAHQMRMNEINEHLQTKLLAPTSTQYDGPPQEHLYRGTDIQRNLVLHHNNNLPSSSTYVVGGQQHKSTFGISDAMLGSGTSSTTASPTLSQYFCHSVTDQGTQQSPTMTMLTTDESSSTPMSMQSLQHVIMQASTTSTTFRRNSSTGGGAGATTTTYAQDRRSAMSTPVMPVLMQEMPQPKNMKNDRSTPTSTFSSLATSRQSSTGGGGSGRGLGDGSEQRGRAKVAAAGGGGGVRGPSASRRSNSHQPQTVTRDSSQRSHSHNSHLHTSNITGRTQQKTQQSNSNGNGLPAAVQHTSTVHHNNTVTNNSKCNTKQFNVPAPVNRDQQHKLQQYYHSNNTYPFYTQQDRGTSKRRSTSSSSSASNHKQSSVSSKVQAPQQHQPHPTTYNRRGTSGTTTPTSTGVEYGQVHTGAAMLTMNKVQLDNGKGGVRGVRRHSMNGEGTTQNNKIVIDQLIRGATTNKQGTMEIHPHDPPVPDHNQNNVFSHLPTIYKWLQFIGIKPLPDLSSDSEWECFKSGTLLCDIVCLLNHCTLNGIDKKPKTKAAMRLNINKALKHLQEQKHITCEWLWLDESILHGNPEEIAKLLLLLMKAYSCFVSPHERLVDPQ